MGLFGSIGRAIGRGIGKVVEKTGGILRSDRIERFGRNIQDACTEKIASERSYDKQSSDIHSTDRLNEILVSFSEGYYLHAKNIEKICIKEVETYIDSLINVFENEKSFDYKKANLVILKSEKKRISEKITGSINNPLSKRMSLDDSECLQILKMDAGTEKQKAMRNFTQKIISEALDNLIIDVRKSLNEQIEYIEEFLYDISEEYEKKLLNVKKHFDKMTENNKLEKVDRENNCITPLVILNAADYVYEILD